LTSVLLSRAGSVVAVEFDRELARKLPAQFPGTRLTVHQADILSFDLRQLPPDYVVVANVPYYITAKIIQTLTTASTTPARIVLLVQREVAVRLAARPGDMSILAVASQLGYEVSLGPVIGAEWFTPPPKVDSQVVVFHRRAQPLIEPDDHKAFFRLVKAGFSAKRKKLRGALAGGLGIDKSAVEALLASVGVSPDLRAEDMTIEQWYDLTKQYTYDNVERHSNDVKTA
ncbi:MAG TPA: rRNA adenine dimethyltransferase family protein, partial [Candidatus Saccharimonadales bacterium]